MLNTKKTYNINTKLKAKTLEKVAINDVLSFNAARRDAIRLIKIF